MGEIFDRALTIYVRNFVAFTLIVLTLIVPLEAVEYFLLPHSQSALQQLLQEMQHGAPYPPEQHPLALIRWVLLIGFFAAILSVFVQSAIAAGVGVTYAGAVPSYAASFARALHRALPLIGTLLLEILLGIFLYIAFAIVAAIVLAVVLGATHADVRALNPAGFVGFVLVCMLVMLIPMMLVALACQFAWYGAVLEERAPFPALWSAFGRIFNGGNLRLSVLIALAMMALSLASLLIDAALDGFASLLHVTALQVLFDCAVSGVVGAFNAILVAVFYFTVRDRGADVDLEEADPNEPVYADTAYATGEERAMIHRFLDRRASMSPERRAATAHDLAERVRPRVPPELQSMPDEALLERL